jgi:hypothetical protein
VLDNPEFYSAVVGSESAKALAAVGGDATRCVPWLDSGRLPHDGDPMTAGCGKNVRVCRHCLMKNHYFFSQGLCVRLGSSKVGKACVKRSAFFCRQLRRIVEASYHAGVRCTTYHHHSNLSEGEWTVLSALCGEQYSAAASSSGSYHPPDRLII